MKKKILTITICVLVFFSLFVLPAAAWGVSTPAQEPVKTVEVLSSDFLAADTTVFTYRIDATSGGANVLTPLSSSLLFESARFLSGGYFNSPYKDKNMVCFSLPDDGEVYAASAWETFVNIDKITALSVNNDISSYDFFITQQAFAMEIPKTYASSHSPKTLRLTLYYYNENTGSNVAGPYMDITQFTTREFGEYMTWSVYLTPEKSFAVARNTIPDGCKISGFSYRWYINGSFVDNTSFYFSWSKCSLYEPSNATSGAVNQMSDRLSADIKEASDKITETIIEQQDQLLNGWTPNPVNPDGSDDITEFEQQEQELIDSQTEGINTAVGVVSGIDSGLLNFTKGFTVMINIFDYFLDNKWLNSLLLVSLGLGIVAFTLGVVPSIIRSIGDREVRSDSEPRGKYDVKVLNLFVNKR